MTHEAFEVFFAPRSAPDDPAPIWEDITVYVEGVDVTAGRPSNVGEIQTGTCALILNNSDHRFTPGNPQSPYFPHFEPGRQLWVRDLSHSQPQDIFRGWLGFPEAPDWAESGDQIVTVTATDRMERLDRARPFISTLTEYIRHAGGPGLVALYPMGETAAPLSDAFGGAYMPRSLHEQIRFVNAEPTTVVSEPLVRYAAGAVPPGDDLAGVRYQPLFGDTGGSQVMRVTVDHVGVGQTRTVATGTVAIAFWVTPHTIVTGFYRLVKLVSTTSFFAVSRNDDSQGGNYEFGVIDDGFNGGTVQSPAIPVLDRPILIAAVYDVTTRVMQLWVHRDDPVIDTVGGGGGISFSGIQIGDGSGPVSISKMQVYAGVGAYTRAMHLAQCTAGYDGLDRQRVDERVATLAAYARVPASTLALDRTSAVMPPARLAGQRPGPAIRSAAAAGQALVFVDGSGTLRLHSRGRRYSPPLAATIPLDMVSRPLTWRTDPPVNVAEVATTSGPPYVAVDSPSVDEHGEYAAPPLTLDSATPPDAANLAAFTVRMAAQPRQRAAVLAFELNEHPLGVQALILGRQIGDMVALSGVPPNAPEDVRLFHIEGIHQLISPDAHRVQWNTGPVLGEVPGVPARFPRVGSARVGSGTRVPF